MSRQSIYAEIDKERDKQDGKYGGPEHDDGHVPNDWIALITGYAGESAAYPACSKTLTVTDKMRFTRGMLRVAAVAIAAIESVDRQAAQAPPHECAGTKKSGPNVTEVGACWYCGEQVVGRV
jgi:hypothetical protein